MEILGGPLFAVAGGGESHGPAMTSLVYGCPPGLYLERAQIQAYLDRRRPGSSKHGTPRREEDNVYLLSGLFQEEDLYQGPPLFVSPEGGKIETYGAGYTTGEPITAVVFSRSRRSEHYAQIKGLQGEVRPGHTDLVKYYKSRGFTDYRGGGRSSYRSTISDVVGGSIARLFLKGCFGTQIVSSISQIGGLRAPSSLLDHVQANLDLVTVEGLESLGDQLRAGELHTHDPEFAQEAGELIRRTRIAGDSLGAAIEVVAFNPPALVGEPLYQSLKLKLMGVLGGLHAVQSCEMGAGKAVVQRRGSENNDPIRRLGYQTNNHGGLLGGVTTGNPIVFTVGFKPTSSISLPQESITKGFEDIKFQLKKGRHDPCVGVRAGVTLESRMAIELLNAVLMHQSGRVQTDDFILFPE